MTDERVLHPDTAMDAVTLHVGDLETMAVYYATALALEPIEERTRGGAVHRVLGRAGTPLVKLVHTPGMPGVDPRQAGLFHTAFLFDTQAALAATVYRAAQDSLSRFVGSSDHLVSEAFYFTDPEGNGIELYWDRPRSTWQWDGDSIAMDTVYLDPNAYLRTHLREEEVSKAPKANGAIGHVHLQVGDVDRARAFYVDALGFEITASMHPSALFASAGGYHHHIAMNTWNSSGAGPRAATLGLGDVAITVPDREDLDALTERMRSHGVQFADEGAFVRLRDPWNTQVTVSRPGADADAVIAR